MASKRNVLYKVKQIILRGRMIKYFRRIYKDKVTNSIKTITDYIDQLEQDTQRLQDKVSSFNKDEEIQRNKDIAVHNLNHSLLQLSDLEHERIKAFKHKHYKECGNSGDYEYRLVGTGIGTVITVKCPKCMSAENVTDSSSW